MYYWTVSACLPGGERVVEDLHGVVGGAAAGVGVVGDDAREPEAAEVQVEPLVVVLAQQLRVHLHQHQHHRDGRHRAPPHLGHPVDGLGSLDAEVGCRVAGRLGPERPDCAWHEQLQLV